MNPLSSPFVRAALEAAGGLPDSGIAWMDVARLENLEAFAEGGLPEGRNEAWKYTPLRALSQRVAKLHVQSTLGVLPERASDVMRQCRQLIGSSLDELRRQPLSADTQPLMPRLQGHAERLLVLTAGSGAPPRIDDVVRSADDMLKSADELTTAFEKQSKQSGARVVNVAGRQRMLSQRAAGFRP